MANKNLQRVSAVSILRRNDVEARTGLSRSTIYLRMAQGVFPRPISLVALRAVGWLEAEINAWLLEQIAASRGSIGIRIPLFGPLDCDIALWHIKTQQYSSGLVQSEYAIAG